MNSHRNPDTKSTSEDENDGNLLRHNALPTFLATSPEYTIQQLRDYDLHAPNLQHSAPVVAFREPFAATMETCRSSPDLTNILNYYRQEQEVLHELRIMETFVGSERFRRQNFFMDLLHGGRYVYLICHLQHVRRLRDAT